MDKKNKDEVENKNAFQEVTESVCDPNVQKIVKDKDVQEANEEINLDENLSDRG